jgi:hypothetical protein
LGNLKRAVNGYKEKDPRKAAEYREAMAKFRHELRNKGHVGAWKAIEDKQRAAREAENERRASERAKGALEAVSGDLVGRKIFL